MLYVKVPAEEQRDILTLQLLDQFLTVLNSAVIHIHLTFLQQVMMCHSCLLYTSIPNGKISGNIHPRRAGHAVTASRTAVLDPASDRLGSLAHHLFFLFIQRHKGTE